MRGIPKARADSVALKTVFHKLKAIVNRKVLLEIKKRQNPRELNRNLENIKPFLFFCRELWNNAQSFCNQPRSDPTRFRGFFLGCQFFNRSLSPHSCD